MPLFRLAASKVAGGTTARAAAGAARTTGLRRSLMPAFRSAPKASTLEQKLTRAIAGEPAGVTARLTEKAGETLGEEAKRLGLWTSVGLGAALGGAFSLFGGDDEETGEPPTMEALMAMDRLQAEVSRYREILIRENPQLVRQLMGQKRLTPHEREFGNPGGDPAALDQLLMAHAIKNQGG
jgi:hypothetical protein